MKLGSLDVDRSGSKPPPALGWAWAAPRLNLHGLIRQIPRPLRFLGVGGIGLASDLAVFTLVLMGGTHPLLARVVSLAAATVVTWRLNRMLTFDHSGRHQSDEALRYAGITALAQSTSYAVFSILVLTLLHALPQAALIAGAAAGALISYNGHRLVSFAPRRAFSLSTPVPVAIASERPNER
jgi:putative flippase GtrA